MNAGLRFFPSPPKPLTFGPITGAARGLVLQTATVATLTITADEVTLKDADGNIYLASNVPATTVTMDANTGANRLDSGAEANSTWYYVWLISDGINVAGLLSLADGKSVNATGGAVAPFDPVLPAGYSFRARLGAVRNDGSGNFVSFYQADRTVMFVGVTVAAARATGALTLLSGAPLTTFQATVPPIARSIAGYFGIDDGSSFTLAADTAGFGQVVSQGAVLFPFTLPLKTQNVAVTMGAFSGSQAFKISAFTL